MYKKTVLYLLLISTLVCFAVVVEAQHLDRSDPVAVANAFLKYLNAGDYPSIIKLMPEEQQKEYSSILSNSPKDMDRIFNKDKKKAGNKTRVTELRKITTFSGKPGIAAKVKKKGQEVFVIIISKEGDNYCYENSLSVTTNLYKELTFIQKVKKKTP